jgi:hypothetical protein
MRLAWVLLISAQLRMRILRSQGGPGSSQFGAVGGFPVQVLGPSVYLNLQMLPQQ